MTDPKFHLHPKDRCDFLNHRVEKKQEKMCEGEWEDYVCLHHAKANEAITFQCPFKNTKAEIVCNGSSWSPKLHIAVEEQCYVAKNSFYYWQLYGQISLYLLTICVCLAMVVRLRRLLRRGRHDHISIQRHLLMIHICGSICELLRHLTLKTYAATSFCTILHFIHYLCDNTVTTLLVGFGVYTNAIVTDRPPPMRVVVRAIYFSSFMVGAFQAFIFLFIDLINDPHRFYLCVAQKQERYSFVILFGFTAASILVNISYMIRLKFVLRKAKRDNKATYRIKEYPKKHCFTLREAQKAYKYYSRHTLTDILPLALLTCGLVATRLNTTQEITKETLFAVYSLIILRGMFHAVIMTGNFLDFADNRHKKTSIEADVS